MAKDKVVEKKYGALDRVKAEAKYRKKKGKSKAIVVMKKPKKKEK